MAIEDRNSEDGAFWLAFLRSLASTGYASGADDQPAHRPRPALGGQWYEGNPPPEYKAEVIAGRTGRSSGPTTHRSV